MMIKNGLMQSGATGTFLMLPSATRVLEKLYRVIDNEMQSVGAHKVTMPCLAPAQTWKTTGNMP